MINVTACETYMYIIMQCYLCGILHFNDVTYYIYYITVLTLRVLCNLSQCYYISIVPILTALSEALEDCAQVVLCLLTDLD